MTIIIQLKYILGICAEKLTCIIQWYTKDVSHQPEIIWLKEDVQSLGEFWNGIGKQDLHPSLIGILKDAHHLVAEMVK